MRTQNSPYAAGAPDALAARVDRLRELAEGEPRLEAVLLYGSWTVGEADNWSDIEAYLFVEGEEAASFDTRAFLTGLAPLRLGYTNMFGVFTVIFDDLMRGEFHPEEATSGIAAVPGWRNMIHLPDPDRAVLLDRTGRLTEAVTKLTQCRPPEPASTAQQRIDELANWTLMAAHLLARGETFRAHSLLSSMVAPQQLQLCRLLRESTAHWLTPSRALEADLPADDLEQYRQTTCAATPPEVRRAARHSWAWTRQLAGEAASRWNVLLPDELADGIAELLRAP